mgnify:CR=1 FL=1
MINISKRLKTLANIILEENINDIADIGCDHALLDIYLLQNNPNMKIIASDVKSGPLEKAKENITKYSLLNKIELIECNGIEKINSKSIVIAGMGAETILEILYNDIEKTKKIENMFIASNNKYELLRKEIIKLGFYIKNEKIIYEIETLL